MGAMRAMPAANQWLVTFQHDAAPLLVSEVSRRFDIVVVARESAYLDATLRQLGRLGRHMVVFLSGDDSVSRRIALLDSGVAEVLYVGVPDDEIIARIDVLWRRGRERGVDEASGVRVGQLAVWPDRRLATWSERKLPLTSTEFSILLELVRHVGEPVSKAQLSDRALGKPLARHDHAIEVHVSSLRAKLVAVGCGTPIRTVVRRGYQYCPDN